MPQEDVLELERAPVEVEDVPIAFIELVDMRGSGFIQQGTENTPNPIELRSPSARFIPNQGFRRGQKTENGKTVYFNERIRYIRNETIISLDEQKRLGIEPSPQAREDKIVIFAGETIIARVRGNEGIYDYLTEAFYNESNPHKTAKSTAIYRVVKKDEKAEESFTDDMALGEVMVYMGALGKKQNGKYAYKEDKIEALCTLFNIFADTTATKLKSLIEFAKFKPAAVLEAVTKWEGITQVEITSGVTLNVIRFSGNVAEYVGKEKIIKNLGVEKMKTEEKISRLADWFKSADGNEAYTEFRSELEIARDKS